MNIRDHIDKIGWSFADKMIFIGYGIVSLFQMRAMELHELGLYAIMINLHTWIYVAVESLALSNIIQFGAVKENRKRVNLVSLIIAATIIVIASGLIFVFQGTIEELFNEKRVPEIMYYLQILLLISIPRVFTQRLMLRDSHYGQIFTQNLLFFGSMSAITLYFILFVGKITFTDLAQIYIAGTLLATAFGILVKYRDLVFGFKGDVKVKSIFSYSLPITVASLLNYLPRQLDVLIIEYYFSASAVGVYYSAKNLFRVFDEAASGSVALIYPTAVRAFQNKDMKSINDLLTKSVSFLLLAFIVAVGFCWLGFSEFFIKLFLPEKYFAAIGQFNLLTLGALALPFVIISTVINAERKPHIVLKYVFIAVIFSLIGLFWVGESGNQSLIPLGLIIYYSISGAFLYAYSFKHYSFKPRQIFRAVADIFHFIKK